MLKKGSRSSRFIIKEINLSIDQSEANNIKGKKIIIDMVMSRRSRQLLKNTMIVVIIGLLFVPSPHIRNPEFNHVLQLHYFYRIIYFFI